jgi:formylglycine-generating enzyme required for sulfatase activity
MTKEPTRRAIDVQDLPLLPPSGFGRVAGRIYDRLRAHFGGDAIFMDIDAIPFGLDFREHIRSAVDQCDILLAVIGPHWAGEAGAARRIDDPRDFVRIEVESALERDLPVIPILIDRTRMPGEADLPASLARLAYRNAIELDQGRDFHPHVDRLIRGIERLLQRANLATAAPPRQPEPPAPQPMREFTNSIGMKLILIPAGEFLMGSDSSDPDASDDEFLDKAAGRKEKHRVRITQPFYLGIHEVTRGQFRRFVGEAGYQTEAEKDGKGGYGWNEETKKFEQNPRYTWQSPGFEQTDEHPVVNVSWNDAVAFAAWLSRKEGNTYRLPTEAEWEYACRAGTTTRYSCGDDPEGLAAVGNIADGTAKAKYPDWTTIAARDGYIYTAPVGRFQPNQFGLYDMHGNVWESCSDGYAADYYKQSPVDDPPGAAGAAPPVIRGGSWLINPRDCRSAHRVRSTPGYRSIHVGFRLARVQSSR